MDQHLPSDPMWATFHREHPEVTLVLLPNDEDRAAVATDVSDASGDPHAPAPGASVADAVSARDALVRRVRLVAEALRVAEAPVARWRVIGDDVVEPQVSLRAATTADTPSESEFIELRLRQLGWRPRTRPESEVLWVDATADDLFVRVTIFDGIISLRATGAQLRVGADAVSDLRGGDDD